MPARLLRSATMRAIVGQALPVPPAEEPSMPEMQPVPRRPKGRRPQLFADPAIDQLHAAFVTLATELAVAFDRIDTLERLLERHGGVTREAIESFRPDEAAESARASRRADLADRLLRPFRDFRDDQLERAERSERHAPAGQDG